MSELQCGWGGREKRMQRVSRENRWRSGSDSVEQLDFFKQSGEAGRVAAE